MMEKSKSVVLINFGKQLKSLMDSWIGLTGTMSMKSGPYSLHRRYTEFEPNLILRYRQRLFSHRFFRYNHSLSFPVRVNMRLLGHLPIAVEGFEAVVETKQAESELLEEVLVDMFELVAEGECK